MEDPIRRATEIFERQMGRKMGAIASLAGIAGAGLLGALRYHGLTDYSFAVVTAVFAGGIAVGPSAERVARRLARRRMQRALADEAERTSEASLELRTRLRAQALVEAEEQGALLLPLAKNAVLAIVGWLWLFGASIGGVDATVGKALGYLFANGGVSVGLFALAASVQGRSITRSRTRSDRRRLGWLTTVLVLTAMALPAWTADAPVLVALAVGAFYFGTAGLFVMVPTTWWMRRRMFRERRALSQLVLPALTSDSEKDRDLLMSTLTWAQGPPALRAEALRGLAVRLGDGVGPHLDRALSGDVSELRLAALELARKIRYRPSLDRLLELEEVGSNDEAKHLPLLLHRYQDPRVEPALLRLLRRDDGEVVAAAAESLGLVGSVDVVPSLKQAARGRALSACTEAIERIRIRFTCMPGQLSVVDGVGAGALSDVASDSAIGALSRP